MKRGRLLKVVAASLIISLFATALCNYQLPNSAIRAFGGKQYPVKVLGTQEVSVHVRVEGQNGTIWRGEVTVTESNIMADNSGETYHLSKPTALGALDEASTHEQHFPYYVTDAYGALFISSVDGEENEGTSGWMYRVNYYSPNVGAGEFILDETTPPEPPHGEVLWYYGAWTDLPLKICVDKTQVEVGEEFTATVTQYSDTSHAWSPCAGATVYVDHHGYATGANGAVDISIASEGTSDVFAEKDGCIRSDRIEVTVTAPVPVTYTLTMAVNGNGAIHPPVGSHPYDAGTVVNIGAIADSGWQFDSWSDNVANPSSSSTTVAIDADKIVIANFIQIPSSIYTLMVTCKPGKGGNVTISPTTEGNQYETGTPVELTATPNDSYVFGNWSGDLSGSANPITMTMNSDKEVTANFVLLASEKPASFSVSHLDISPERVQPNQQVNISINIANVGGKTGSYEAVLYINGQMEDSQTASISPSSTQTVVFSITKATPGTYTVSLVGQQGQFTVVGNQVSDKGLDTGSMIAIIVITVLIAALVLVFRRIRKEVNQG